MSDVSIGGLHGTIGLEDKFSDALQSFIGRLGDAEKQLSSTSAAVDTFAAKTEQSMKAVETESERALAGLTSRLQNPVGAVEEVFSRIGTNVQGLMPHLENFKEGVVDSIEHPLEFAKGALVGVVETLGPAGLALGAFAGVATLVAKELWDTGEAAAHVGGTINDMSEKMSLTSERTSKMKYAFDLAGGSIQQASTLMFMMQRRMSDSPKQFEEGLKNINLSLADLKGLQPDEQMYKISKAFQENTDSTNRASTAMSLFSRAGREAIPILMKDLQGLSEESEKLGDIWSEADTKAAEEFEIASRRLDEQFKAMTTSIGRELIPVMLVMMDMANKGVATFRNWIPYIVSVADKISGVSLALTILAENSPVGWFFDLSKSGLPKVKGPTKEDLGIGAFEEYLKGITDSAVKTELLAAHMRELRKNVEPLTIAQQALTLEMKKGGDNAQDIAKHLGVAEVAVKQFLDTNDKAAKASEKATAAHEKLIEKLKGIERVGFTDSVAMGVMAGELTKVGTKDDSIMELAKAFEKLDAAVQRALDAVHAISLAWPSDIETMSKALGGNIIPVTRTTTPMFGTLPGGSVGIKPGIDVGKSFKDGFERGIRDLPNVILHAIEGGGNVAAAVGSSMGQSIGNSIDRSLQKSISGSKMGGMSKALLSGLSDMIPVIGALAGPLIEKLMNIGGPSKQELGGRDLESRFEKQFKSFDDMAKSVGRAYLTTGRTLQQANADLQDLLAAEKQGPEAVQAIIDKLQGALDTAKKIDAAISGLGIRSHDDLVATAEIAQRAYEKIAAGVATGQFTADNATKAYRAFQQALADAGDEGAKAWLKIHGAEGTALDDATAAGYQTVEALQTAADKALALARYMRDSGKFTATDIADAFDKAGKAQDLALGRSSKAIDDLKAKYKSLDDAISQEAWEPNIGVVETDLRKQRDDIAAQIKNAGGVMADAVGQTADAGATAADSIAKDFGTSADEVRDKMGKAASDTQDHFNDAANGMKSSFVDAADAAAHGIEEVFAKVHIVIPIDFNVATPSLPGGSSGSRPEAEGEFGYAPGPMTFSTRGDEFVAFGGEGGGLEGLLKKLGGRGGPKTLQVFIGGKKVKDTLIDELENAPTSRDVKVLQGLTK